MKRMLLATMASTILMAGAPALAMAAHRSGHHSHARRAARHAHRRGRVKVLSYTAQGVSSSSSPTSAPPQGAAPPQGLTPPQGAAPSGGSAAAGTVTSFSGGVLTITLTDGTVLSGKVDEETEIHCLAPPPSGSEGNGQGDDEGDMGGGGVNAAGHDSARFSGEQASHGDGGSEGGEGEEEGEDRGAGSGGGQASCSTAALVAGATVGEAELSLDGSGAVWDHVDLID